jgi:hypothetical protein
MTKAILLMAILLAIPAMALDSDTGKVVTFDVASGGTLAALCSTITGGITALVMWLNGQRKQRMQVSPDPLNVKGIPPSVKSPTCDATHKAIDQRLLDNKDDHSNIFPRLSNLESRMSALEGTISEIRIEYKSIDDKLTVLLRRR